MRALVGVCLILAGCASGPDSAAQLKAGNEAFDRWETGGTARDLESAIEHYGQVRGEQQAFALKYQGDAYRELRRLADAEASYRKALAMREAEGWAMSPRIADLAHDLATEASRRYVSDAKEFFYLSKQMHGACPWVGGDSAAR